MRRAHCLLLSIIIKRNGALVQYGRGSSECKMKLSTAVGCRLQKAHKLSSAPLVLEHNIKKKWCPVWYVRCSSLAPCANCSARSNEVRPVQCLFLSSLDLAPCSLVFRSLRSRPYADCTVDCKEDINASRALLVLEHNTKK